MKKVQNTGERSAQKERIADFFSRERKNLVRFVRRMIDDAADRDGEDIVQDVMVGLYERADISRPVEELSSYVYRSLRNRIVDAFRRRSAAPPVVSLDSSAGGDEDLTLADVLEDSRVDVFDGIQRKRMIERVYSAIDRLGPRLKAVLIATEFEGKTYRELSEEWGVPVGTLLSHKHRAIQRIRTSLGGDLQGGKEFSHDT
jgi:RNA polymerase sigma factor (sigma-70 family)